MRYLYKLSNLQDYVLSNSYQYFEMVIYTIVCFFLPLFIGHPQLFIGVTVNALLIVGALNLKSYKLLPIIIAPSLGALSRGVLFGPFTVFLLYMIPFIWIGNIILVYSFKLFNLHLKKSFLFTLIVGSVAKAGFLFLSAFVLFKLSLVPVIFLTAMGLLQFFTSLGGGFAAFVFQMTKKRFA